MVSLPLRTAATTAALRRITHRLVFGGGRSPIDCTRTSDCSTILFTGCRHDFGGPQKIAHLREFYVGAIGSAPPHISGVPPGRKHQSCPELAKHKRLDSA